MKKKLLLLTVLFVGGMSTSIAQTSQLTSLIGATIASIAELSGSSTKDDAVFNFTTAAELTAGKELPNLFTLTAKANKAYYINVKAAAADFSGGVAGEALPVSVLEVKIDAGSYVPLSAIDQSIIGTNLLKIAKGTNTYAVSYRMTPGDDAAPASNYSTTLTFTITAP